MPVRMLVACLLLVALGACAGPGGGAGGPPSFATSGRLEAAMRGTSTIGFAAGSGVDPDPSIDARAVEDAIREAIVDVVTRQGYTLVPPGRAERVIGYAAVVDDGAEDAALFERLGVSPGVGVGQAMERGTVALFVWRPGARDPIWRGAAQGALEPRAGARARAERITLAVQELLADLPPASP